MMVVEQNRYLQAWLKFSQLKPATNMQLPSCESDLNKTRCVDLVTERPGQIEGSFTGQSQAEITYLVAPSHSCLSSTSLPAIGQTMARSKLHQNEEESFPGFHWPLGEDTAVF